MRQRRPDGSGSTDNSSDERSGGSPGKRSLTQSLQRKADAGPADLSSVAASGSGSTLPAPVQAKMEDAFDFGFSGVRVHQGGEAQAMGAQAFAQGSDLHFAPGHYDPGSERGQELIGHELAHVVQQSEGRVGATTQFKGAALNDDPGLEQEADVWGARAARGESVGRGGSGGGTTTTGVVQAYTGGTAATGAKTTAPSGAAKTTPPKVSGTATLKANVNVRKAASKNGEILETAKVGTSFKVLTNVGSWYQIEHTGGSAYITTIADYVDFKPTAAPAPQAAPKTDEKAQPEADGGSSWLDSAWSAASQLVDTASEAAGHVVDAVAAFFDGTPEEQKQAEGDLGKGDLGKGGTAADAGKTAGADTSPSAPTGSLLFKDPFEIVDGAAKLRDAAFKDTGKVIAKGTRVYVAKADRTYVQIVTSPDVATKIVESDQVWTAFSNLGGTGADVGLGNEKSDDADKTKADDLRAGLPPGRTPGASAFKWQFSGSFMPSLEGKALEGTLMAKVQRLMQWAVENDMVTGDITIGDGVRGPKTAHKMCVSWNIQHRWGTIIKLDALKALPGGKDNDGTTWYQDGWTDEQIKANAYAIRSSSKIAAAGHEPGDSDRLPLPLNGKPGVSRHCTGRAVDVTIPWRAPGKDASTKGTDVWAWEEVYKQFGLHRPLHKDLVSDGNLQENWHIEETGKKLDGDDETDG